MVQSSSTITLSSLYSSGQCLLSVLGSIGVILLFAGIPQLIYAPQVNPGSLMTFLLGALLISLMVAGNAFIGYKYRQLVRERREESRHGRVALRSISLDDKPPSYDDLLQEEGLPPTYSSLIKEKPPRYEELVTEVFNWQALSKVSEPHLPSSPVIAPSPSYSSPTSSALASSRVEEMPIIVPIHKNLVHKSFHASSGVGLENLAFQNSSHDLLASSTVTAGSLEVSASTRPQEPKIGIRGSNTEHPNPSIFERALSKLGRSLSSGDTTAVPAVQDRGHQSRPLSTRHSLNRTISLQESSPEDNATFS